MAGPQGTSGVRSTRARARGGGQGPILQVRVGSMLSTAGSFWKLVRNGVYGCAHV